jgi:hypothetical protein
MGLPVEEILPPRVIDVGSNDDDVHLIQTNSAKAQYLVLSYRWGAPGGQKILLLTKANLDTLLASIPVPDLPTTIKQAISMTRSLGFRYLWVDSLCLIQDDVSDIQKGVDSMSDIYQRATCTIAATGAEDSFRGLYLPRRPNGPCAKLPCIVGDRVVGEMLITAKAIDQDFQQEIEESPWAHRGWVFQERLLSRRIIHFGSSQVYWECRHGVLSETEIENERKMLCEEQDQLKNNLRFRGRFREEFDNPRSGFEIFWNVFVEQYSRAELSDERDRLKAIVGITTELALWQRGPYVSGVWLLYMPYCLLWVASGSEVSTRVSSF